VDDHTRYEEALRRGHSFSWDQRWPEAIREFETALEAQPKEPAAYAGLGMAYNELGDLEKALECYKLASRYSRGDMIYLKHVADNQERLGLLVEAGQTFMALGEIQLRRKNLDEAVVNWLRAISLDPHLLGAHQRLVAVYRRQGLNSNAVREYLIMAELYSHRGEQELALKACQLALEIDPRNAEVMTAMELIRKGEEFVVADSAMARLHQIQRRKKSDIVADKDTSSIKEGLLQSTQRVAQQELAQVVLSEGDSAQAEMAPIGGDFRHEIDTMLSQALDFQTREKFPEAIDSFERAIAGGLKNHAAHFCLGLLYHVQKRPRQAIRELEEAAVDVLFRPASYYAIGKAFRESGDPDSAVLYFVEALKYIDIDSVDLSAKERIAEQYRFLSDSFDDGTEPVNKARFMHAIVSYLDADDWQRKIAEARRRLNAISTEGQTLILGDIFAAGSMQVLQSLYLSQEYAQQGMFDSAVEEAYRAIQYSPFYLAGHVQLAELMVKQERPRIAVTKFLTIGDTCLVRGDVTGAIHNYERAVELSPLNIENRIRLIRVLIEQGLVERALDHYLNMGEVYYNLAELEKARDTYISGLKLAPKESGHQAWRLRLLRAIADIDMQRLDWKRALIAYNELKAANPNDREVMLRLVDLNFKVDQPDMAVHQLDQFLGYLVRDGKSGDVVGVLENLAEQWPNNENVVNRLTRLYVHQGRRQDAIKVLDTLGETQLNSGETGKAVKTIERILQLDPPNSASYQKLLQRLEQEHA